MKIVRKSYAILDKFSDIFALSKRFQSDAIAIKSYDAFLIKRFCETCGNEKKSRIPETLMTTFSIQKYIIGTKLSFELTDY